MTVHVSEEAKQLTSLSRTAISDDFIAGNRLHDSKIVQLFVFPNSRSTHLTLWVYGRGGGSILPSLYTTPDKQLGG